jgi:CMP-N,N'-diacetyllegionaminic acid synthase
MIQGRPLVEWTLRAALGSHLLDRVLVSSDSEEVLELAARISPDSPLRRPDHLCLADSKAIDYVKHALGVAEAASPGGQPYSAVAILQPSSPFTRPIDIDSTISLLQRSGAESAVSVTQVPHDLHPVKFKYFDGEQLMPLFESERDRSTPRDLPAVYVRNGSVYCTRRSTIMAGSILGESSVGYVMPREYSVDINDEFDLRFADFLAAQLWPNWISD